MHVKDRCSPYATITQQQRRRQSKSCCGHGEGKGQFRGVFQRMKRQTTCVAITAFVVTAVSANAAEICAQMGATELVESELYCVSSVLASQSGNRYGPGNLFDGNNRTAWCEGVPGNGEGERIYIRIEDGAPFQRLLITNGYAKSTSTFRNNGRARTLNITTDRGDRIRTVLPDTRSDVAVQLPGPVQYRELTIKIVDTYPGAKYQDTCITFLSPDFEYDR